MTLSCKIIQKRLDYLLKPYRHTFDITIIIPKKYEKMVKEDSYDYYKQMGHLHFFATAKTIKVILK